MTCQSLHVSPPCSFIPRRLASVRVCVCTQRSSSARIPRLVRLCLCCAQDAFRPCAVHVLHPSHSKSAHTHTHTHTNTRAHTHTHTYLHLHTQDAALACTPDGAERVSLEGCGLNMVQIGPVLASRTVDLNLNGNPIEDLDSLAGHSLRAICAAGCRLRYLSIHLSIYLLHLFEGHAGGRSPAWEATGGVPECPRHDCCCSTRYVPRAAHTPGRAWAHVCACALCGDRRRGVRGRTSARALCVEIGRRGSGSPTARTDARKQRWGRSSVRFRGV